jgi:chemosensory pili system protein ChpB (putative protein-glutamate methylesterase)
MVEAGPAVALLFDEPNLGEQLRSALQERGARIVHEGPLAGVSRELLSSVDADVLVVNLDDEDDGALDRLDETLDGDRPRVVFNDGQASRRLEGWDRARWARHLAMKVLAIGDADPPRPPAPAEAIAVAVAPDPVAAPAAAPVAPPQPEANEEARQAAASETLAAELEALLAAEPAEIDETAGTGLNYAAGEGMPLHEGNFEPLATDDAASDAPADAVADSDAAQDTFDAAPASLPAELAFDAIPTPPPADAPEPAFVADAPSDAVAAPGDETDAPASGVVEPAEHASFQLDHLELAPIDQEPGRPPVSAAHPPATAAAVAHASDSWSLLDPDAPVAPVATAVERAHPSEFGIHKLSAADYLAPDVDDSGESPIHPGMSLELVSLEEAIAPQHFEPSHEHEMVLDLPSSALPRLVVLGATTESTASVGEFLAALPADLRATVLHTQHLAGRPADALVEYFATQCALPVRLAEAGMRARAGEVIVVPSDRQVTLRRDGSVELQPIEADAAHVPSIDVSFTQAASMFGRDVVAIVFAGRSTDAVAGCQAVHDRGGEVWIEAAGSEQAADMVSGVLAEHLSHHAGTPRQLAARLAEQFSEGQP